MKIKMLILFMLVLPAIVVTQASADMVAYWPLDTGTGGMAFDTYDDYDGTLIDEPEWVSGFTGGAGDYALEFNYDNSVNFGNVPTGVNLTLAFWMYSALSGFEMPIGAAPGGYSPNPGWMVMTRPEGENYDIWFRVAGDQDAWNGGDVVLSGAGTPNTWTHLAFTFDGTTRELTGYVNGEYSNDKICEEGRSVDGNDDLVFGQGGDEPFKGVLDDVAIWDTALTAGEVLEVYEFGPQPAGAKNPNPENRSTVGIANPLTLSWTNMDPNYPGDDVYVDVWWGTEPNALAPGGLDFNKIVTAESVDSTEVDSLAVDTYYWRVDSYIYGADNINEPNRIEGVLWMYTTSSDAPPTVVIETLDQMTWTGEGVPLDATVTDDGASTLTIEWTADLPIGFTASFDPGNDVEDPTVTLTKVPYIEDVIVNAGFEAWILGDDGWGETPGWSAVGTTDSGSWNPPATAYASIPEGNNVAWVGFNAEMDPTGAGGGLAQVLAETFAADTTYTLTVEVGKSPIVDYAWPGYKVQLLAGGTVLEEDDNTLSIDIGTFATSTVTYTYHSSDSGLVGQPLEIRLLAKVPVGTGWNEINFDDVRLTADPPFDPTWVTPTGVQTVTVTVAVGDVANPASDTASIEIDVYDDACHMARVGEGKTPVTDFNGNCITDLEDLAVVAAAWLDDYSSTGPADL